MYSFLVTWSRYKLQYDRKYVPYINSNCGDANFHQTTLGFNHCDEFLEIISIPAWERALFEEIQKLPVCSDGKCDGVVLGITNNKTWLCVCFAVFLFCCMIMLRIKWYLEHQIRTKLPLDHPDSYIETINAPMYVNRGDGDELSFEDQKGQKSFYRLGLRRRINIGTNENTSIEPCDRYTDISL